jgi:hypothetical protein
MQTLKEKAAEKSSMNLSEIYLVYAGKVITEDKFLKLTVRDVGIMNNSTIFVVFRMRGGNS